jgi:hypothetical protein
MKRWPVLLLLLLTLGLYQSSIHFGFFWDDPIWYGHVAGKSWAEALQPQPDYQFYRPGALLYNWFFARPDGTFSAPIMHQAQLWLHLLTAALSYAVAGRMGLTRHVALWVSALTALAPLSFQAVTWAAPQQPVAAVLLMAALLLFLEAMSAPPGRRRLLIGLSLAFFGIALTFQESTVPLSLLPLALSIAGKGFPRRPQAFVRQHGAALLYPILATGYLLLWLQMPRLPGYTALNSDPRVLAYLAQGYAYPLLGRLGGYSPDTAVRPALLLAIAAGATLGAVLLARRRRRGAIAALGALWALLALSPAAAGLDYSYVQLASRLFYGSAFGVSLMWAAALAPLSPPRLSTRNPRSWLGFATLAIILLQGMLLIRLNGRHYAPGTAALSQLVEAIVPGERFLALNFPDRYAPKRPPFPLGYWGLTLAPVSVELADFVGLSTGLQAGSDSRSMPWLDGDARAAGPFLVDMRGEIVQPEALWSILGEYDAVYVSRFAASGTIQFQNAGRLIGPAPPACGLVVFGDAVCLHHLALEQKEGTVEVMLTWSLLGPVDQHDTVFLHLGVPGQAPVAQADGHPLATSAPMWTWDTGVLIEDRRTMALPAATPSDAVIKVGVYNWVTGTRLEGIGPNGAPLPDGVYFYTPPTKP